jgi:hypothetical protein
MITFVALPMFLIGFAGASASTRHGRPESEWSKVTFAGEIVVAAGGLVMVIGVSLVVVGCMQLAEGSLGVFLVAVGLVSLRVGYTGIRRVLKREYDAGASGPKPTRVAGDTEISASHGLFCPVCGADWDVAPDPDALDPGCPGCGRPRAGADA